MDAILPPGHVLDSKVLRYFVYIMVYVIFTIYPIPLFYFAYSYEDQNELKQDLLRIYSLYYDDFMSAKVAAVRMDGTNPFPFIIIYTFLFYCIFAITTMLISSSVIWKLTGNAGAIGSVRYRTQQRQLFLALVIMVISPRSREIPKWFDRFRLAFFFLL